MRVLEVTASDEDLCDAFRDAVATIEAALDEGAVFPRVREADGKTPITAASARWSRRVAGTTRCSDGDLESILGG